MPVTSQQVEWLSLVETTGPFLTVQVLEQAFPQGLESVETPRRQQLRSAYEEWRDAVDEDDELLPALHDAWVNLVLTELLEYDAESLTPASAWRGELPSVSPHDGTAAFQPSWIVHSLGSSNASMFIKAVAPGSLLASTASSDGWLASEIERMTLLCRAHGVRLGLVTNGEEWVIVNAPIDSPSGQTTWYARYWFQEPATLKAFQSLLGVRRCFGPTEGTLEALLDESLKHQDEVTDTLGEQVRRATEVLIQALDKADEDRNRDLLRGVSPSTLYEAGLTVMMRLVFVLCAEERGLFLLGDPAYDQNLAVSTLRGQLAEEADQHGDEVLERRYDAWSRLLSVFRAVYAGVEHEDLRIPAMGGSLFDPDRYPFLEGRSSGTSWMGEASHPLPIDNKTVLLLLNSLQVLEHSHGALVLSYRALDVEQIGHVYEGLLEHTVVRVPEVTIGVKGSSKNRYPAISLSELESLLLDGESQLASVVEEVSGRNAATIVGEVRRQPTDETLAEVLNALTGDVALASRLRPFANLVRKDAWGDAAVYRQGSFMVAPGMDRRETGTHYTPKSLTEKIVAVALEPFVYQGPREGDDRDNWSLSRPDELLNLRVCDPAMGSGAFLVQACRYLAEKLVLSWEQAEARGDIIRADGVAVAHIGSDDPLPAQPDVRLLEARRLVSQRCLYGVDINPLAVELAKLSMWLVTLAKGRPFGFLDHNMKAGDSLLGLDNLDQLTQLRVRPTHANYQPPLFSDGVEEASKRALDIRQSMRTIVVKDMTDVARMERSSSEATFVVETAEAVADAIVGYAVGSGKPLDEVSPSLPVLAEAAIAGDASAAETIRRTTRTLLDRGLPQGVRPRRPFHWVLQFPEVFSRGGFDAIVSNPPFLAHKRIAGAVGEDVREYLMKQLSPRKRGKCDLVVFFLLRFAGLLKPETGILGMITSKAAAEGKSREIGLAQLTEKDGGAFTIMTAVRSRPWPGNAQTLYSIVWLTRSWNGLVELNDEAVTSINSHLDAGQEELLGPVKLASNAGICHQGVIPQGKGFMVSQDECALLVQQDPRSADVLKPYLDGHDVTDDPNHAPSRYVIDFGEMTEQDASRYAAVWALAERRILPERITKDAIKYPRMVKEWWKHWNPRLEMRRRLAALMECLVIVGHAKYVVPVRIPAWYIPSSALRVFCTDSYALQALLSSSIHTEWAIQWGSTLGESIRYNPSVVFESLPIPEETPALHSAGATLQRLSAEVSRRRMLGLTDLYNLIHDPGCRPGQDADVDSLREVHADIDRLVLNAYGWDDIDLDLGFHEYRGLTRLTMGSGARDTVLHRLLMEDNRRVNSVSGTRSIRPVKVQASSASSALPEAGDGAEAAALIATFLRNRGGWRGKGQILAGTGLPPSQWTPAVSALLEADLVERRGQKKGAEYRAIRGAQ